MKGIKEIWVLKKVHVEGQISHYKKKKGQKRKTIHLIYICEKMKGRKVKIGCPRHGNLESRDPMF